MSDVLSASPPSAHAADADHRQDGAQSGGRPDDSKQAIGSDQRRLRRREIVLGEGLRFAFARESIAQPTQWSLHHDQHSLIVHLDGPMRRLQTRIEGIGRLRARPAAGDLWLIPAGRRYQGEALGGEIAYAELTLDPARLADLSGAAFDPSARDASGRAATHLTARMKHHDPLVHSLAARLARLSGETDDLAAMLCESLGQALCLYLLREYGAASTSAQALERTCAPASRLGAARRRRLEDYIRAHLDRPIRLAALAALTGLSVHRLLIGFRAEFGVTPIQYVLAERLNRAAARLRGSNDDIVTIAIEAGFSSHSHLSALFKKHYGLSPSEYRRRG